jgi:hypothetical protein
MARIRTQMAAGSRRRDTANDGKSTYGIGEVYGIGLRKKPENRAPHSLSRYSPTTCNAREMYSRSCPTGTT